MIPPNTCNKAQTHACMRTQNHFPIILDSDLAYIRSSLEHILANSLGNLTHIKCELKVQEKWLKMNICFIVTYIAQK